MREQAPSLNWNAGLIPRGETYVSVLGGKNLRVIQNDHEEDYLKVIEFLTSKEEFESYIDTFGYISARKDVAKDQFKDDVLKSSIINTLIFTLACLGIQCISGMLLALFFNKKLKTNLRDFNDTLDNYNYSIGS